MLMRVVPERTSHMVSGNLNAVLLAGNRRIEGIARREFQEHVVALCIPNAGRPLRRNVQAVKMQVGCIPLMMPIGAVGASGLDWQPVVECDVHDVARLYSYGRAD